MLAFLLPVGFYCFILAYMNRRSRPLMVTGDWDAVGLLFAVAGFFLVTVPMLLGEFFERSLADDGVKIADLFLEQWIIWLAYFLLLISGSVFMILWRSQKTLIYNIDPDQFPKALEQTFANLGLGVATKKERLILTPAANAESTRARDPSPGRTDSRGLVKESRGMPNWKSTAFR